LKASKATATRYAKALFAVAREASAVEAVGRELAAFRETFDAQPEIQAVLLRPWLKPAERRGVAQALAERAGSGKTVRDFIALVAARGRMDHLGEIADAYRALEDAARNRVRAQVRTPAPLGEDERRRLAAGLRARLGKDVVLEEAIDRSLLGGFVAQIGSLVVDGSVDGQLARLRERLVRG
jgi:F-type H+-transporting ATPase subunit delta